MNTEKPRWGEERIRQELARLDARTGLHGSELPIRFTQSKHTLGSYQASSDGSNGCFSFSQYFYEDDGFSEFEALDTIRHEYAHYLCHMRYGQGASSPHGREWKACCRVVQALPRARYSAENNQRHLALEQKERQRQQRLDDFLRALSPGALLVHPIFGTGRVQSIRTCPRSEQLFVTFEGEAAPRRLSAQWAVEHCSSEALSPQQACV